MVPYWVLVLGVYLGVGFGVMLTIAMHGRGDQISGIVEPVAITILWPYVLVKGTLPGMR